MKKKFYNLNRILVIAIALITQVVWLFFLLGKFNAYSDAVHYLMLAISFVVILFILRRDKNSDAKISWIVLILIFPLFGGILYVLLGGGKGTSDILHKKLCEGEKLYKNKLVQNSEVYKKFKNEQNSFEGVAKYLINQGFPVWSANDIRYFPLGEDAFKNMLIDLENAKESIYLEYFIISSGKMWDSILEILKKKAQSGVDVRIIYDDFGSIGSFPANYDKELLKCSIKCVCFNPFRPFLSIMMNNRDHRKIMLIDDKIAYTGGINIADEYINEINRFGHWKDTAVRVTGNAVFSFKVMFLQMWNSLYNIKDLPNDCKLQNIDYNSSQGYVQPYCDTPMDSDKVGESVYISIINNARNYIYIYTPYLIISANMQESLILAAKRGVKIKIITPAIPDKKVVFFTTRTYYEDLIASGIEIYEYTPGFIHAKSFVCDDSVSVNGTINMDFRSMLLHFECGVVFYNTKIIAEMKKDFEKTLVQSYKVTINDCKANIFKRMLQSLIRLFAPLM